MYVLNNVEYYFHSDYNFDRGKAYKKLKIYKKQNYWKNI